MRCDLHGMRDRTQGHILVDADGLAACEATGKGVAAVLPNWTWYVTCDRFPGVPIYLNYCPCPHIGTRPDAPLGETTLLGFLIGPGRDQEGPTCPENPSPPSTQRSPSTSPSATGPTHSPS